MSVQQLIKQTIEPFLTNVDNHFQEFTPLNDLARKLSIKPSHIIIPFFILSVILLASGALSHLFVAIFGMIYPSYMTFKSLNNNDQLKSKHWLTYWIIFGLFTSGYKVLRNVFFFLSLPSYNVFRILLYVWLFHPKTNGAGYLYEKIKPKLVEIQQEIETESK